jgi:hypothetical protein
MRLKSKVVWSAMPRSLAKACHSGQTYHLHLQPKQAHLAACFLLGLIFNPEDGGSIFIQNVKLSL